MNHDHAVGIKPALLRAPPVKAYPAIVSASPGLPAARVSAAQLTSMSHQVNLSDSE